MSVEILDINSSERGLFAKKDYLEGDLVTMLEGDTLPYPTRTSIQIGREQHLESDEGGYMNHHCNPNCRIIIGSWQDIILKLNGVAVRVHARKDIKKGDELTFDYETTEHTLSNPFECRCHNRLISGGMIRYFEDVKRETA
jgi:SET domain-containing protein